MSLALITHNNKDIVAGAESLSIIKQDGVELPPEEGHEKLFRLGKKALLTITGEFYKDGIDVFIRSFQDKVRNWTDFDEIYDELVRLVEGDILRLQDNEDIEFFVAGFKDKKPIIKGVARKAGEDTRIATISGNYTGSGIPECKHRAEDILIEKGIKTNPKISELRDIVSDTIQQCISEFPDDLGGELTIIWLHRD